MWARREKEKEKENGGQGKNKNRESASILRDADGSLFYVLSLTMSKSLHRSIAAVRAESQSGAPSILSLFCVPDQRSTHSVPIILVAHRVRERMNVPGLISFVSVGQELTFILMEGTTGG